MLKSERGYCNVDGDIDGSEGDSHGGEESGKSVNGNQYAGFVTSLRVLASGPRWLL